MNEYISQEEIDRRLGLAPKSPTLQRLRDAKPTDERGARVVKGQTSGQITDRNVEQIEIEAAKCPAARSWSAGNIRRSRNYLCTNSIGK